VGGDVGVLEVEREIVRVGEGGNEFRVGISLGAADTVMEMDHTQDDAEIRAQFEKRANQGDAVRPAGDRHADAVARTEQGVSTNGVFETVEHGEMVQLGGLIENV
jgi:hypothetical protein